MAWVAEDTFESYTNADLAGQTGGTGWNSGWTGSGAGLNYDVQSTVAYQGTKAVINSTSANADMDIRPLLASTNNGMLYVAMRAGSTSAGLIATKLRGAAGVGRFGIIFNSSGNIILEGTTNATIMAGYAANTWYVIRLTFDTATNSATAAWSSAAYGTSGTFSAESSAVTGQNSGSITGLLLSKDARAGNDYWDYISGTSPFVSANGGFFRFM